ncbi:MAG: hypothetical protein Q8S21_00870 [Candidatus Paracaedibacteraceae bacterium]|nr:hypothetical protein [Candidatus Paracaedibacteraceae bacterium]
MKKHILIAFLCATSISQISFISESYAAEASTEQSAQELFNALSLAQKKRISAVAELFFYVKPTKITSAKANFVQKALELKAYAATNPVDGGNIELEEKLLNADFMDKIKDSNKQRNIKLVDIISKRNEYLTSSPSRAATTESAPRATDPILSELDDNLFESSTKRGKTTREVEWKNLEGIANLNLKEERALAARAQGKIAKKEAKESYERSRSKELNAREMELTIQHLERIDRAKAYLLAQDILPQMKIRIHQMANSYDILELARSKGFSE